jgi:predicted secreted protein
MRSSFALLLPLLVALPQAWADSHGPVRNLVSLAARAAEQVDNDLLVVVLYVEHEGPQQAAPADSVNQDMAWALAAAKPVGSVKAQTLDYQTQPVYDDRRISAWRVRQSLRLESLDKDALTGLLGTLQERLAIQTVGYEVSPARREQVEARLIEAAIQAFSARAERVTRSFGRGAYTLVNVNIDTQGGQPVPISYAPRMLAMKAEVADPSLASGVQTIEVAIHGTIELGGP